MSQTTPLRVFVSCAHEDSLFAQSLIAALTSAGADVWPSVAIRATTPPATIEREIEARPVFVAILTSVALTSQTVRHAVEYALWCDRDDVSHIRVTLPVVFGGFGANDPRLAALSLSAIRGLFQQRPYSAPSSPLVNGAPNQAAITEVVRLLGLPVRDPEVATREEAPHATPDALSFRGRMLRARGNVQRAMTLFARATQGDPTSYEAWLGLACCQYQLGDYSNARTSFDRALGVATGQSLIAWMGKGAAWSALKDYPRALTAYEQAIQREPTYAIGWSAKGEALRKLKRYDGASQALKTAHELSPNNVEITRQYGLLLCEMGQHDATCYRSARFVFDDALKSHPDDAQLWRGRAEALIGLKKSSAALVAYRKATALAPNDARLWLALADACYETHDYPSALDAYAHALQLSPTDVAALNGKGNAQRHLGQWAAAEQTYRQALALQPDDSAQAFLWANLALAYEGLGQTTEAARATATADALERRLSAQSGAIALEGAAKGDTAGAKRRPG